MTEKGCFHKEFDDLIITSGGQQANELSCKVLLNEGDTLLCESPSFIGSLNAFRSYNVHLKGIEMEDDGIDLNKLENALKTEKNVKLLYLIPNFQNPTGKTMSLAKRKAVYELACKYDFIILEDDPYGELRFAGENVPCIKSFDTEGRVIYSSTFSKIISSGFRTGYCSAPAPIIQKMVVCKQVADVHSNMWAQVVSHRFMSTVDREAHFKKLRAIYKEKGLRYERLLPQGCSAVQDSCCSGKFFQHRYRRSKPLIQTQLLYTYKRADKEGYGHPCPHDKRNARLRIKTILFERIIYYAKQNDRQI